MSDFLHHSAARHSQVSPTDLGFYESIKQELKIRPIYECEGKKTIPLDIQFPFPSRRRQTRGLQDNLDRRFTLEVYRIFVFCGASWFSNPRRCFDDG